MFLTTNVFSRHAGRVTSSKNWTLLMKNACSTNTLAYTSLIIRNILDYQLSHYILSIYYFIRFFLLSFQSHTIVDTIRKSLSYIPFKRVLYESLDTKEKTFDWSVNCGNSRSNSNFDNFINSDRRNVYINFLEYFCIFVFNEYYIYIYYHIFEVIKHFLFYYKFLNTTNLAIIFVNRLWRSKISHLILIILILK